MTELNELVTLPPFQRKHFQKPAKTEKLIKKIKNSFRIFYSNEAQPTYIYT